MRERSWWGWGYSDSAVGMEERDRLARFVKDVLDVELPTPRDAPPLESVHLPKPRTALAAALKNLARTDPYERALHTHGRSFRDVVRNLRGDLANAPDVVALPSNAADVQALLEWAAQSNVAVIPYGGGSSVVGGVEPIPTAEQRGAISLDLRKLARVLDVDETSLAARIQAGAFGPAIEDQLAPYGLTLRHQPQSFECSTLGGWIVTRSAGHFATRQTRIDDRVESVRLLTPSGVVATRRLPSSGAGPDVNRLVLGSEGTLGVVTDAWVRVLRRPQHRASATVRFDSFTDGLAAIRALVQAELSPANCRLLDPVESMIGNIGAGFSHLLLAFESADQPVNQPLQRGVELARDFGGAPRDDFATSTVHENVIDAAARSWREGFVRAPYIRDALITLGLITETFESAITWDRLEHLLDAVHEAAREALGSLPAKGLVSCRITHAYPDGAAPYWTVIAAGDPNAQLEQWDIIKDAVSEAIVSAGGTITHHHAVGRDHGQWYAREQSATTIDVMHAIKHTLDPEGILNPGVLLPGERS